MHPNFFTLIFDIMHAKKFLLLSIFCFTSFIALYVLLVDKWVIVERDVPYDYRQYLLETSSQIKGKVIVESGSNSVHGIDPFILSEYFNAPVLTTAANAGYPLRPKIFNIEKFTHPGDVVIFPLEWNQYAYEENLPANFLASVADKDLRLESYFNNLPWYEKLKFIFSQYPLKEVITGVKQVRNKEQLLRDDLTRLSTFEQRLAKNTSESFGNSDRNAPEGIEKDGSHNLSCDQYILGKQFAYGFIISETFKDNLLALSRLEDKGVTVYFTWPAVVDHEKSGCYQSEKASENMAVYTKKIKTLVKSKGFQFIGDYQQSRLPPQCFLNTYYHLRKDCATIRTQRLVEEIIRLKLDKINSESSQADLAALMNQHIERDRKSLTAKLINHLPTVVTNNIAKLDLSQKLLLTKGWSSQEVWGIWSVGKVSSFSLNLSASLLKQETIEINIQGQYYNGSEKTAVEINGLSFGKHVLINKTFSIPAKLIINNQLDVHLTHSSVISPAELGKSKDHRKIKFGLMSVGFD